MGAHHIIVADQHFILHCESEERLLDLRQRYGPFAVSAETAKDLPVLFELTIEPLFPALEAAQEMARFDCEGAECVYEQTADEVSISLCHMTTHALMAQMHCDRTFHKAKAWLSGGAGCREYCINNFLMMIFAFSSMATQTLLFHASVVSNAGRAYLFLGKSGTGKSTHSRLWIDHIAGSELVNDDNPAVGIRDGQVFVYGTPWSGKTPCYRNVKYPVGAFVRLHQEPANTMGREAVLYAFASLLPSCSGVKWDKRLYDAQCDTLSAVIGQIPVFQLGCLPDEAAARLCHATVTESLHA